MVTENLSLVEQWRIKNNSMTSRNELLVNSLSGQHRARSASRRATSNPFLLYSVDQMDLGHGDGLGQINFADTRTSSNYAQIFGAVDGTPRH